MPLHLGSPWRRYSLLFSLPPSSFCLLPFAPSDVGDEWILANLQDREKGKKISRPMRELFEDEDVVVGGVKEETTTRASSCLRRTGNGEEGLPTTSGFRMIDRSHYSLL